MNQFFNYVTEQIAVGRRIDAFTDRLSRLCVEKWELGIHDEFMANTILAHVRSREAKIKSGQAVPFRRARFPNGRIYLGRDLAVPGHLNGEIWLPLSAFSTPWLVVAGTGHGKSVLESHLSLELAKAGPTTWQLSYYKDDLLAQLPRFQAAGLELVVVRAEDFKVNPLHPGQNDPRAHLTLITSLLPRCLNELPPRAELILRAFCHELYREYGIFDGQKERAPNLFRLYEKIRIAKGLNIPARDALLDRLGSFLERLSPRCGAWLKGWTPTDLAKHSLLLLFRRLGDDVKRFLLEWLIDHVFQHQVERGLVNSDLELFIFADDAQFLVNSQGSSAMSGLDRQVGRNRGASISVAFFPQALHGISPHLLPNVNAWLMGRTVEHEARMILGRNFGLTDAQNEWVRLSLRRGQFVGVLAEGDWHEPFAFASPNVDLTHNVTEADVLASQLPLASLPVIPDEDFRTWERHPLIELQPEAASSTLSTAEGRLLSAVISDPGKAAGEYARKLGTNGKTLRLARQRLVQLGLVRERQLQLNHRGKPAIVLEPLPAARNFNTPPTEAT
jgi:hypothetical protein